MKMKKVLAILLLTLLMGCGSSQIQQTVTTNPELISKPQGPDGLKGKVAPLHEIAPLESGVAPKTIGKNINFSNKENIAEIMDFLASDDLQGREAGSMGIAKAADFIENIFKENHIATYFSTYRDTLSNFEKPAYNMVGFIEGSDPTLKNEIIIFGAHYDHLGVIEPENGDNIANGANDNASGSTIVLELARYFGNAKTNKRSLIFALFSAEEKGLLGSKHLAEKLKDQNVDLYAMLNFEMVGVPLVDKDYLMYLTGFELSNLAEVSNKYAGEKVAGFLPKAKEFELFRRSDNYPFHLAFNVPSQTYSTFDFTNFDYYHKVGDEVPKMDLVHMANLVNKVIPMMEGIINSKTQEIKYN